MFLCAKLGIFAEVEQKKSYGKSEVVGILIKKQEKIWRLKTKELILQTLTGIKLSA